MLWFIKFTFLLSWIVVAVKQLRLDEGERTFDDLVNEIFLKITKTQKEIETILTFDLKSLLNSHQDTPIQVIKTKQFKHNNCYEIGILLQLPNKQYLVKQILQINESLINNVLNFQLTNFTYYIDIDEKLICEDFIFISNWSVQVLCFKEQINLLTIYQEKQITRMVLDTPIEQSTQRKSQIFYYSEQQLSLILAESLEQESMLIFIQENSIQRIISLDQYIEQKSLFFYMPPELIQAQLWRQYFLIIFTQRIIVQFDLKTGNEYYFQSKGKLNKIILIENDILIQEQEYGYRYLQFHAQNNQYLPANHGIDTQQIKTSDNKNFIVINRVAYNIKDQNEIQIEEFALHFDFFEVIYQINGLIIIKDMNIYLYQVSQSYQYFEMDFQSGDQLYNQQISIQLNNNYTVLFNTEQSHKFDYKDSDFDLLNYWDFSPIKGGPYGIIQIQDDPLNILSIPEFLFCFQRQYDYIFILHQDLEQSYWIIVNNRILYFIICHNQLVVQQSEIMEYSNFSDIFKISPTDISHFIVNIVNIDMSLNDSYIQHKIKVDIVRQSEESYSIKVTKQDLNIDKILSFQESVRNLFHANFKNDTVFIFRGDQIFNTYQFQHCEVMDLIAFSQNVLLIIFKNQTNQITLANYKMIEGKLLKLKELPTFGYLYLKIFDIQRQNNIITLLIENEQQKQYLAVYKIDLFKIDCQVALIEYDESADIRYVFSEDRYLYNFKKSILQPHYYYSEQYEVKLQTKRQFQTITRINIRFRNQLIDQIITLNFTLNDYRNSLVAYQDTVTMQREALMKLKVQQLFYGFIHNIFCKNCEITPIFQMIETYGMQNDKPDSYNDQLIQISDKYIIFLIFNSKFLIFNRQFKLLNELNAIQDQNYYSLISSLNICDACFLFKVITETGSHFYVKQLVDFEFKVIFQKELLQFKKFDKFEVTDDFIIQLSPSISIIQDIEIYCYKFVLDSNNEIYLQSQQFSLKNFSIYNLKIKQIGQNIIILSKMNMYQYQLCVIEDQTSTLKNYTIKFHYSFSISLHFYKFMKNGGEMTLKFYAFSIDQVYLGIIKLTQLQIEIDLNSNNYTKVLIIQPQYLIEHINYISDQVIIVTFSQTHIINQYKYYFQVFQLDQNQRYIHPVQSMSDIPLYHFKPFINNTFIYTSYNQLGIAKLQEFYQVQTNENFLILEANQAEKKAIVQINIIQNQSYKLIELIVVIVFGVFLQMYIYYQKTKKSQPFKQIEDS